MAYKQRWLDYFDLLDGNANGTLEPEDAEGLFKKAEASGRFSPEELEKFKPQISQYLNLLVSVFDFNKNGKVTKDEWLVGVEKFFIGKNLAEAPAWWLEGINRPFANLDVNKNGEISEEEYVKYVTKLNPSANVDAVKAAFQAHKGPNGKFDLDAFKNLLWTWSTSPDPIPDIILLTPFLQPRK